MMENLKNVRKYGSWPNLTKVDVFMPETGVIYFAYERRSSSLDNISTILKRIRLRRKRRAIRGQFTMAERLEHAAPYNIFYNCLYEAPETYKQPNSIQFIDLLCPSLGKIKASLHICFVVDLNWLIYSYEFRRISDKPLTILHGSITQKLDTQSYPNVTVKQIKIDVPYACHDTKMGIFVYEDESVRIYIGSVNPFFADWNFVNQGIWVSPRCPKLEDSRHDIQGESPTGFKKALLNYLRYYKEDCFTPYIDYVRRANFSEIKVCFVYSVPGTYNFPRSQNTGCHLHQVSNLLSRFCEIPDRDSALWKVICQTSIIGFLGKHNKETNDYFKVVLQALAKHKNGQSSERLPEMNVIYPSTRNVVDAFLMKGSKVGYDSNIYADQKWLNKHLLQWKVDAYNRSKVIPHIRSYFRISPCSKKLAYFLLTSANLTRSGWGVPNWNKYARHSTNQSTDISIYMRNYDVGVMFIPKFFGEEYFDIQRTEDETDKKRFPFLFSLPLVPYEKDDVPWISLNVESDDDDD